MATSGTTSLVQLEQAALDSRAQQNRATDFLIDPAVWQDLEIICKCDCITPKGIPKDLPTLELPVICYLELTAQCNSQCVGCSFANRSTNKSKQFLNFAQWRQIIHKLTPSVQRLQITGGEATLHPEFEQIIDFIDQNQIPYVIFTNGLWRKPHQLLDFLAQKNFFQGFLISIHGANALTHETFTRIPGSFSKILQHIQLATRKGIRISTSTVIFQQNINQLEQIQELGQELGADSMVFNRYIGLAPLDISVESPQLQFAANQIEKLIRQNQTVAFGNSIPHCFSSCSADGCLAGTVFMSVDPAGNVKPCNHADLNCGNLLHQSVREVWQSRKMNYWRNLLPESCKQCSAFSTCHGGCRAEALRTASQHDPLIHFPAFASN